MRKSPAQRHPNINTRRWRVQLIKSIGWISILSRHSFLHVRTWHRAIGSQRHSDCRCNGQPILKMDQFEFLFELEFLFDPSIECDMLNYSEGSQALPMPAGASLEALTASAHSCSKAQSSLKFKPAEKRLAGKLDAKDSWFAAGFPVTLPGGLPGRWIRWRRRH